MSRSRARRSGGTDFPRPNFLLHQKLIFVEILRSLHVFPLPLLRTRTMAVETSLPALLDTLTQSLTSATSTAPESSAILPPKDGISLLDVKNELLLSYLQNLVFLIILKLRHRSNGTEDENPVADDTVVKKLVELRVYLEKGVRPLEGRLKYQIDKVLRAADDAARPTAPVTNGVAKKAKTGFESDAEESDDASDKSEDEEADSDDGGVGLKANEINDLQYRPNPAAFMKLSEGVAEEKETADAKDGVYRPPRITATAMPTTGPREKAERKPHKSAILEEFVSTELSSAPVAEPSIGTTIGFGGRMSKSEKQRREEAEIREYEEKNYVRLPTASKKDRAKKDARQQAGYGGEEWRGLGEGLDRIEKLTQRKGGNARSALEKSRKRPVEDGPRDSGVAEGQGFAKRLKTLNKAANRTHSKKKN